MAKATHPERLIEAQAKLIEAYRDLLGTHDRHNEAGHLRDCLRALNETITDTIHNLNTQSANSITSTNEEWRGVFLRLQEQVNAALEQKGL